MVSLAFHLFVIGTVIFALCSYDCSHPLLYRCVFSTLCLQVGNRLGFWGGFSCFVSFIWCHLFAWLIACYTNGCDWDAASNSAHLNCTSLTRFCLTAGLFHRNLCIVCFGLLVSCYSLLQYSRPAWLELFVDHMHTHSMSNLRWQPHWLPRLTSLPRKSRDWWRTRDSSLGQPTENKID